MGRKYACGRCEENCHGTECIYCQVFLFFSDFTGLCISLKNIVFYHTVYYWVCLCSSRMNLHLFPQNND